MMEWRIAWRVKTRATQRCRTRKVECDQFVIQSRKLFLLEKRKMRGAKMYARRPVRQST